VDQLDRWNEFKEVLLVQTRAEFENMLLDGYETLFFRYKKADHRYWKLINFSLT
jgi:hypothetical protein